MCEVLSSVPGDAEQNQGLLIIVLQTGTDLQPVFLNRFCALPFIIFLLFFQNNVQHNSFNLRLQPVSNLSLTFLLGFQRGDEVL